MTTDEITAAAEAIEAGQLVVYPTETVYGLGADALDPAAVKRLFEVKGRSRSKPVSMAVPDRDTALEYVDLTDREAAFVTEFLPGPVTVVVERRSMIPDVLTAGRDRVGLRIPDHEVARELARHAGPLTATSANVSGSPSARRVGAIDPKIREETAAVLDGGETPGGGSTVVDLSSETVHRRGANAEAVERWLDEY